MKSANKIKRLIAVIITISLFVTLLSACGQGTTADTNYDNIFLALKKEPEITESKNTKNINTDEDIDEDENSEVELLSTETDIIGDTDTITEQTEKPEVSTESETDAEQKTEYTYEDVSKTVYTTSALNVRSGPWITFDIVGSLDNNFAVTVTGVCNETGWYRISYNGEDAYFDCNFTADTLTTAQPKNEESSSTDTAETLSNDSEVSVSPSQVKTESNTNTNTNTNTNSNTNTNTNTNSQSTSNNQETVSETYTSGGFPLWNYSWHSCAYIGRMRIPSVGVNVGLCNTDAQWALDTEDTAAIAYHWEDHSTYEYSTIYCADHNYQGFRAIADCTIGCVMYIDGVDGNTYKYVCDRIDYNGYNTGFGLNDSNGNTVSYTGGLWCYTCHDDSTSYVYMVHFVAV